MSGQDLFIDMQEKIKLLDLALNQLGKRGGSYAQCEQAYRIALAKQILIERDHGVPVTIISDICRGNQAIAKLKFDRDVSEVNYKAAMEAINIYKIQIKMLGEQIDREWHRE